MYTIAFVWAGVSVLLPVLQDGNAISVDAWISFVQRFLFVIVITLPFDIRDLNYDVEEKINTIPKNLGVKGAKFLGIVLLVLFFILECIKDQLVMIHLFSIVLISILSAILLIASSDKQNTYYASFFVEGLPMIWVGVLYLFSMLLL
jgi:4-hydroxybenzoate polyprenyltransferase